MVTIKLLLLSPFDYTKQKAHATVHTCLCDAWLLMLCQLFCADNANFYVSNGVPFVMGTTGGDRDQVIAAAEQHGVYAVVAPQMGKQVSLLYVIATLASRHCTCVHSIGKDCEYQPCMHRTSQGAAASQ